MAELTIFGGAGQIGGNKLLLRDAGTELLFDFGMSFENEGRYFAEFLKPRDSNSGLHDYFMTGLLPAVNGLYRSDASVGALEKLGWQQAVRQHGEFEAHPLAMLLSHAHMDHLGYVGFLDPEVRIVSSALSAVIAKALQDTGQTTLQGESVYYVERHEVDTPATRLRDLGMSLPRLERPKGKAENVNNLRPWLITDFDAWTTEAAVFWGTSPNPDVPMLGPAPESLRTHVGGLEVRAYPVDHSIMGALAYAVETSAGWVVYTGDFRMHGKNGHLTRKFAEEVSKLAPIALICEGTRVHPKPSPPSTEEIVYEKSRQAVKDSRGLIVADFGPRNVERLVSFLDIAREGDRVLVVTAKDAYLLEGMASVDGSVPQTENDPNMAVYMDRTGNMGIWQQLVLSRNRDSLVRWEDIAARPADYLLCFSLYDLPRLLDIEPSEGTYLFSTTEPFNVELELDMDRLRSWVTRLNLRLIGDPDLSDDPMHRGFHTGGHAPKEDVFKLIEMIRPKTLIPVHTEYPELMAEHAATLEIKSVLPSTEQPTVLTL